MKRLAKSGLAVVTTLKGTVSNFGISYHRYMLNRTAGAASSRDHDSCYQRYVHLVMIKRVVEECKGA